MDILMPGRILNRHVGGNTTYARSIADGLRTRGHSVRALPHSDKPMATAFLESAAGVRPRSPKTVLHYVADTGPLVRTRTPSIVTVHGVASRWESGIRTRRQEAIWRTRVLQAIRSTDLVITVSNSSAADIQAVFSVPEERIRVIPHGIDMHKFEEDQELSAPLREIVPNEFLLYVGNIEPRKNIRQMVQALESPRIQELGLPLVIAGKPAWNSDDEMRAIRGSRSVIYLGFVSDCDRAALMQRAQLFLFPSRYEGFGFPVLESLASGAPVLTTDRGALREVAGPAKLLRGTTAEHVASGIGEALSDSTWLTTIKSSGKEWARNFTWHQSVSRHISAYLEVLER